MLTHPVFPGMAAMLKTYETSRIWSGEEERKERREDSECEQRAEQTWVVFANGK